MLALRKKLYENSKQGFTLAELLVVVAIIAILVAVSIPIFTGKLNEARQSTDLANERAAKAAAFVDYINSGEPDSYTKYYDAESGTMVTSEEEGSLPKIEGYNQTEKKGSSGEFITENKDSAIIYVSITPQSDGKAPKIEMQWMFVKKPGQS